MVPTLEIMIAVSILGWIGCDPAIRPAPLSCSVPVPNTGTIPQLAEQELVPVFARGQWKQLRSGKPTQQPGEASSRGESTSPHG